MNIFKEAPLMRELNNTLFPKPIGAYSNGLSIPIGDKNLIVLTGQQAIGTDGNTVFPNEADKQTEFIFERIETLLNEADASLANAIKVVIYVTNMDDFSKISPIRNKYLGEARPVSTLVEVSRLTSPGCVVEIDLIAIN